MKLNHKLGAAVSQAEKLFGIRVVATEALPREEPDQILNSFLTADDGRTFFLKEIADHSFRPESDLIFTYLSTVKSDRFKFLVPLAHTNSQFSFRTDASVFHLFPKEIISPFQPDKMSFPELLDILGEMHQKIAAFKIPAQSFRTFASWIERPLKKIPEKFGSNTPFIRMFQEFMTERYSSIQLVKGNIHWDIHQLNMSLDPSGRLTILDLDLVQEGEYACDFTRAACMYSSEEGNIFRVPEEVVENTVRVLRKQSPRITERDVKFFMCRTPMGPMQSQHYFRDQAGTFAMLRSFEDFVGTR